MEQSRSRITFADDFASSAPRYNASPLQPPPTAVVGNLPTPPPSARASPPTMSVEDQLSLNSCVDELVNILGTSVSRKVMINALLRHDLNFEMALDEILQSGLTNCEQEREEEEQSFAVDVSSPSYPAVDRGRTPPSPPPPRPDPRSSPEFWSDESGGASGGGGGGGGGGCPIYVGDSESRGISYLQENAADCLGFGDVLTSRLASAAAMTTGMSRTSSSKRDNVESTLEDYCASRISSPEGCVDESDLVANIDDLDHQLPFEDDDDEADAEAMSRLLFDEIARLAVKRRQKCNKEKSGGGGGQKSYRHLQKLKLFEDVENRWLSYGRLSTQMRRETAKAKLILKNTAASSTAKDDSGGDINHNVVVQKEWVQQQQQNSQASSRRPTQSSTSPAQLPSSTSSYDPPLRSSRPQQREPSDVPEQRRRTFQEAPEFLAAAWANSSRAWRQSRVQIKKLPQLKKARCKASSTTERRRDSPLWTYARFSRALECKSGADEAIRGGGSAAVEAATVTSDAAGGGGGGGGGDDDVDDGGGRDTRQKFDGVEAAKPKGRLKSIVRDEALIILGNDDEDDDSSPDSSPNSSSAMPLNADRVDAATSVVSSSTSGNGDIKTASTSAVSKSTSSSNVTTAKNQPSSSSSSLPQQPSSSSALLPPPPPSSREDLDFLDDDFASVSSSLLKKKSALPSLPDSSSPLRSPAVSSSNYSQYFAQGARPKSGGGGGVGGGGSLVSSSSSSPSRPIGSASSSKKPDKSSSADKLSSSSHISSSTRGEAADSSPSVDDVNAASNVIDGNLDASASSSASSSSSSVLSSAMPSDDGPPSSGSVASKGPRSKTEKETTSSSSRTAAPANNSPSPSPLSRLGKGISLQQLANEHAKSRATRSQSPLANQRGWQNSPGGVGGGEGGGGRVDVSKLSSSSDIRKISTGSSGSPSRICSWESTPALTCLAKSSASSAANKPSLSALSSLARAHTSVTSDGSLLKSLETLNLAKMTADGFESRHLGLVLGLPGFRALSFADVGGEEGRKLARAISVMDIGIWGGGSDGVGVEGGNVCVDGDVTNDDVGASKRFQYRRQRRGGGSAGKAKGKRNTPSKSSVASSTSKAKIFLFDVPSPDDVVSEKQKMAFEHSTDKMSLMSATSTPSTAVASEASADVGKDEVVASTATGAAAAAEVAKRPSKEVEVSFVIERRDKRPRSYEKRKSSREELKEKTPDDWESLFD